MKFRLEFDMDNAAFQDALGNWEVATILHKLANDIQGNQQRHVTQAEGELWPLKDSNGNTVGEARVENTCDECGGRMFEAVEHDEAGTFTVPYCPLCEDGERAERHWLPDGRCGGCGHPHYVIGGQWVCPACDYECFYCGNATLTDDGEPDVKCLTCGAEYNLTLDKGQGR